MIRHHGRLQPLDYPHLTPQLTREVIYSILTNEQRQRLETDWQIDLAYSIPGQGPLPRERVHAARRASAAFRLIPHDDADAALARPAARARGVHQEAARVRARHRPDRLGQVHDARRDARPDQRDAAGAHPHDRGPDRVPAQAQEVHRQPARAGRRRAELRARPEGRAPSGPGRDPRRRDERPRDDLDRADRGRDRPPRVRHAPHAGHLADGGPHRGRLPAEQQQQVRVQLSVALQGIVTQQLLPTADGQGRIGRQPRCSCRPRQSAT